MIEESKHICDYGCGKEAKFQFKNGRWCCSKNTSSCDIYRAKISKSREKFKGENHPLYGKPCSEERKKKISDSNKEWNRNNTPIWLGRKHTEETKRKVGEKSLGRKHDEDFKERWRQRCLDGHAAKMNKAPRDPEKMKRFKENRRQWMLENGTYVKSFIKKISNDEIKLGNLVKELYPDCKFQYSVLNFLLDIALPELKIAIEFDGYYHYEDMRDKEEKEYYKIRREKIENEGWKFYRVTMFDKFPNLEEVKQNIQKLIEEVEEDNED